MDMTFNVRKIFQDRLAASMGLDKYQYIMDQVNSTNAATDIDFQRTFNGFYIIRRNEHWRKCYYEYFESVKKGNPTFESIITYLYEHTGNIEPSFSSKMLVTIFPEKPIWDRYVVQNLNIQLTGATKEEKLENAIILYADMEQWYDDFLESEKGKECIREFDRVLPDHKGISSIKKIDSILWSIRWSIAKRGEIMDLLLNNVLNLTQEEIDNSKIEFNMQAGSGGQPFLDRWLKHSEEEKISGTCTDCSYWGWYGKQRNFYPGQWVFSFARMTDDEWLLISAAEIVDVPVDEWATANVLERFVPLFGRLIVKCKKGNTFSRYVFNLSKYLDQATVKEILPCLYSGENFEGYDRVHLPYHRLADIFNGKILPTYYEALKKITGVYCLTDTHTGKLYIGSATGEEGVAQRWGNYLDSKHGGNKKLIALYEKKGAEYFERYFTYTLLEYFGLSYDPIKILEREQYWKKCLDSIRNGYNDN